MKISRQLFALTVLSAQVAAAVAAEVPGGDQAAAVDTSQWKCKFCVFQEGWSGNLDLGLGYVSRDSFKFGEYTGLNDKGAFLVGNGDARFRGEDARYLNIDASNLGLDSRAVRAEGGKQGRYELFLDYKELPHFISDSAVTPFLGTGGNSLTLPTGWVFGGTTPGMTALPGSLHEVDLETKRKRIGVGVTLIPTTDWKYGVTVRHETKEGTQRIAGTFFLNSAQLVMPVDYVTDQIEAFASYAGKALQARFAYYVSNFRDGNDSLTWANPYTPPPFAPGATAGQLALPPDNQFHQILASAGYQFSDRTSASADIALGRMTQDENFLPATLNSSLSQTLPRNSLDGKVDTTDANLKLVSAVTDRLRLNAAYTYSDRDNKTPQAAYPWVSTDVFVNTPRTNLPYSFTQKTLKLSADYRTTERIKASVGFDNDIHKRSFQESDKTRENTFWGRIVTRNLDNVDLTFKVAHAVRDNSGYAVVPGIDPPENPLMRKYNMADRTRDSAGLRADVAAGERVNVGVEFNYANDDYSNSTVGLTSSDDVNFGGDASVIFTKQTSLHFFLNHEEINSKQAGSQAFSTPDWTAQNNDTVDTAGIGVKHTVTANKLDVGADYTTSRSHGQVKVDTGAPSAAFPDQVTLLDSVKLYATYRLKDNISLHGAYWYERYNTKDWMFDGITSSTIPNVLTLGEQPPSYHVNVIMLSVRYKF